MIQEKIWEMCFIPVLFLVDVVSVFGCFVFWLSICMCTDQTLTSGLSFPMSILSLVEHSTCHHCALGVLGFSRLVGKYTI